MKSLPAHFRIACFLAVVTFPAMAHAQADPSNHGAHGAVAKQQPWGIAGEPRKVTRTVEIKMTDDMRFVPDRIEIREGETIRFALLNRGKLMHEFVIGSRAEFNRHAAAMAQQPAMKHDEPSMVHVGPGKTGTVVWTFNRTGEYSFACLVAGHYESGMFGVLSVKPG